MAQAVLSGKGLDIPLDPISIASKIGGHDADMAKLAAALNSGAGVSGNPLHVTISERKSPHVCCIFIRVSSYVYF